MTPEIVQSIRELRELSWRCVARGVLFRRSYRVVSVLAAIVSCSLWSLTIWLCPSWSALLPLLTALFVCPIVPGAWREASDKWTEWMRLRQDCLDAIADLEKDARDARYFDDE